MAKHHESNAAGISEPVQAPVTSPASSPAPIATDTGSMADKALTVAAVGVAAALIEVELIPGMLLGVAAMLAPNLLPKVGNALRPVVKSAVRAGYNVAAKTRESVAEASEQFQDIVAEVKSEQHGSAVSGSNGHMTPGSGEAA
jgi:Protein of unknown function (DUF5132)